MSRSHHPKPPAPPQEKQASTDTFAQLAQQIRKASKQRGIQQTQRTVPTGEKSKAVQNLLRKLPPAPPPQHRPRLSARQAPKQLPQGPHRKAKALSPKPPESKQGRRPPPHAIARGLIKTHPIQEPASQPAPRSPESSEQSMEYSGMQSVAKGPAAQSVSENTPSMPNPQAAAEKSLSADQLFAMAKMAYTQWEYGKLERARTIFQTLVMQKPNEPWFRCALGSIYQRQKQFAAALQQYNIALQINARDIPSRVNRGEIHLKIGKQQEAINDLMYAVKADATGKHPSALRAKSLLKAISLNPKNNPRGIPNGVV